MPPHTPIPSHQEPTSTPRVLTILSYVLEKLVARNDRFASHGSTTARIGSFNGVRPPAISLANYVERIFKYTSCSPSCFVVGFVYIDRLVHRYPDALVVSPLNVHRLVVTSVMVASKILDDVHHDNAFYARVGGVTNPELNKLELELLFLLDFDLHVSPRVFESYCQHLEKQMLCNGALMMPLEKPLTAINNDVNDVSEISNGVEEEEEKTQSSSSSTQFAECS